MMSVIFAHSCLLVVSVYIILEVGNVCLTKISHSTAMSPVAENRNGFGYN